MALNEKQEKFAQSYILHRNATEAAKAAGYSSRSANNQGYRLLQIEEVTQRIAELELKVLDLNRKNEELKNALPQNQKENGKRDGNEEEKKRNEKKEEKVNG